MRRIGARSLQKLRHQGILASIAALCLVLLLTATAFAGTVNISDQAGVLNQSQVTNAASSLGYPLNIYTVNNFSGSESSFDQRTASHVSSSNLIVISISTNLHHIAIKSGSSVPLSDNGASSAKNAFISSYQSNSDYTVATVSSINSLESTLGSSGNNTTSSSAGSGSNILGISGGCLVGLIILGLLFFFVLRRNRSRGAGFFNRPQYVDPNYGQPYPPNYGPGPYGPGYPNYPQNQGMNPLAAGGLGAAAGGLLGYELGKEQGESQERRDEGNYGGNGGDFGGGNGGNFGGGASGDFGGGGGGGDFGGGASGDFGGGGGGDAGGGGASGNF